MPLALLDSFRGLLHCLMPGTVRGHPDGSIRSYNGETAPLMHGLQDDLRKAKEDGDVWKRRADEERESKRQSEAAYSDLQRRYNSLKETVRAIETEIVVLRERADTLKVVEEELRMTKHLLRSQEQQNITLQAIHAKTTALLETRSAELHDAQQYLTKADQLSDADILRVVEQLNSEIMQAGSGAVDTAIPAELVGAKMAELLQVVPHSDDTFCVQLALQAALVTLARWIIAKWILWPDCDDGDIRGIYAGIRMNQSQAVAGRWRALTRAHAKTLRDHDAGAELHKNLTVYVAHILALAGAQGSPEDILGLVQARHSDRLRSFVNACLHIHKAIGEELTSADFETVAGACGARFEADCMKDEWGGSTEENEEGTVLCTTAMGLRRVEKRDGGEINSIMLLKPGVALDSVVKEMTCTERDLM
ncbi:predicted protein [Postia placenta Mad-698-R]|nr:predicted protein [Postia placenta Mad-698-R]